MTRRSVDQNTEGSGEWKSDDVDSNTRTTDRKEYVESTSRPSDTKIVGGKAATLERVPEEAIFPSENEISVRRRR